MQNYNINNSATAHLTRRINAPYRCLPKQQFLLEKINNISEYLYSRQFTKSTGKLQGFFHHEAMLHGEMSGVRAPLGAVGDLSEQALFLSLRIHIIDIVGNGKTRYFILHTPCRCGHR